MDLEDDLDPELDQLMKEWLRYIRVEAPKKLTEETQQLEKLVRELEEIKRKGEKSREILCSHVYTQLEVHVAGDGKHLDRMDLAKGKVNKEKLELENITSKLNLLKAKKAEKLEEVKEASKEFERLNRKKEEAEQKLEAFRTSDLKKEYQNLSEFMGVTYKNDADCRIIGIMHSGQNGVEKLFLVDKENKSEKDMREEFWASLNRSFKIEVQPICK